ncbi:MAG TPA: two-component regulator propeller domain-containing protein, partial [Candidatus Kapabacteria bacterium]|nr:two-component regulator propeller domain-containing protein [Candidatus Kapabacteria bacterium]
MKRKNKTDSAEHQLKRYRGIIPWLVIILLSTFLWPTNTSAQSADDIEFEHISIKQGLSQGSVNCILQDNRGFMWFGTQAGLNRYDGHDFKTYSHDSNNKWSLSHSLAISIYKNRDGTLWIGTYGGG